MIVDLCFNYSMYIRWMNCYLYVLLCKDFKNKNYRLKEEVGGV